MELQGAEDNTLLLLGKQLADTNRGIKNMLNAIQQGILTSSTKERLEERERPKYSRQDLVEWISRFKYGGPNNKVYQGQIIDIFLNSIYVFDDRLVFTYSYQNGTQTVTLAAILQLFLSIIEKGSGTLVPEPFSFALFICLFTRSLLLRKKLIDIQKSMSENREPFGRGVV